MRRYVRLTIEAHRLAARLAPSPPGFRSRLGRTRLGAIGLLIAPLAGTLGIACGGDRRDEPTGGVVLSLQEVPADVVCVRLTAAAARTTVRDLQAVAGSALTETLSGIPLGDVTFTAAAYDKACRSITASTVPSWVNDPVEAAVVLGRLTSVTLTMHRNGRTKVSVDFPDEPACAPPGAACSVGSECCSRSCKNDLCEAPSDAGMDIASDGP